MLTVDEIKANEPRSCVAGPFGSSISSKYFVTEGVPVIRGNNLTDNLTPFVPHGFAFVSEEKAESFKAQQVKGGDLVFTCWGTLGQVGLIPYDGPYPTYIISNKQLKLRPNLEICEPRFLYYYFASPQMVQHIRSVAIGAAVPGINLGILKSLQVVLPPLPIQRKIVGVLSAYDDLIENNTRRIEILEEMARSLYREWFVNFRFPGHEQVKMVDSELGLIPEGWEIKHLPDICSKVIDGTHDSPKPVNEGYYLVTGKHIVNGFIDFSKCYFISPEEHEKVMKRSKPEKGDTIFSNIGTLGSTALVEQAFEFSIKNVALFKPLKEIYSCFIYLCFSSPETLEMMEKKASGTSQRFFSLKFLRELELVVPSDVVFSKFDSFVKPILEQRSLLNQKNQNLRQTRDLLLPKLISGEIDVENLEINTGEIAA